MIRNNRELELSREALINLEKALLALKEKVEPVNKELFIAMSQDYYKDILKIRNEIEEFFGFFEIERFAAPIWMTLQGVELSFSNLSLSMLSNWTGRLRKAVQNILIFKERNTEIPSNLISKITDFRCIKIMPGSIKIGLTTPDILKDDLFFGKLLEENRPVEKSVEDLLEYIKFISTGENKEQVKEILSSKDDSEFFLMQVLALTPSSKSDVNLVKFEGSLNPSRQPLYLNKFSREVIKEIFKEKHKEEMLEYEGKMREIDLDKGSFTLREVEGQLESVHCLFPPKFMDTSIKSLDSKVRVTGYRKSKTSKSINLISIEPVDE